MTDLIEANSMGHEPNLIDIYSASWGPTDDGKTVDGPRNATMRAIVKGVNEVSLFQVFFPTIFIQNKSQILSARKKFAWLYHITNNALYNVLDCTETWSRD